MQVHKQRKYQRDEQINRGRQIEEETGPSNEKENKNLKADVGLAAARRDKLTEFLRQKKAAQESKKNKTVQPFR